ncbi:MAG: peptidase domain-containing ABC transporter [Halieaceae bacterium]|nr:peptidase domain-containing ABC transporter [Halieaceae bacterium]
MLRFGWRNTLLTVLQAEAAECGLACLTMIAGYHGDKTDMVALRRRFTVTVHGLTLKQLIEIASAMHLAARALRFEMGNLAQLQVPCILHWDMNHFVVLETVNGHRAIVHDPAIGRRDCTLEELAQHVSGVALELMPTEEFEPGREGRPLRLHHFWSRIVGLKRSLLSVLLASLLLQLFGVVSPFYMQTVVDDVLLRSDSNLLLVLALGFGMLLVIEAGTSILRELVILNLSSRLGIQMAANVFRHLIRLPLDYFQKRHLGDIVSRFDSLDSIRALLTTGLVTVLVDGIMAVITLVVMFIYDVQLTFIVLALVLTFALIRGALYPSLERLTRENLVAAAKTQSSFMESVRAIQTIKLHQSENDRQNQWHNKLANTVNTGIVVARVNIICDGANIIVFGLGNIVVIYHAANAVMANVMTLGMLYAFMSFRQRFVGAMNGLIEQIIQIKMLGVHLDRLADIVFARREPDLDIGGVAMATTVRAGELSEPVMNRCRQLAVVGLGYRYGKTEKPVIQQINMTVEPGECVAIVGASGSGKTTLIKCMMGLLRPTEGEVLWGGRGLSQLPHYRQLVGGVMQEDQLLSGSIADNIACFDHHTDLAKVSICAQMACIQDDILSLPMQYNTLVGDMGSGLSGGQKQRIVLARALYRSPAILFMDEATSHLDAANERRVNEHIASLEISRVIVAHRAETIKAADRVIEL